jgi:hypothetical protein
MPLCVGWHLAVRIPLIRNTWEHHMKSPGLDLYRGEGGIRPCLVLWRGTYPCWLSPVHSDPDSTQILTWHCSGKSQTIRQLTSIGATLTGQVPIVQPL